MNPDCPVPVDESGPKRYPGAELIQAISRGRCGVNIDFDTGKLTQVVRAVRPHRHREYGLLLSVCFIASIPYVLWIAMQPAVAMSVIVYAALFKVGTTFVTSLGTDTAHHVRFLLAGSNPVGMTGGCSLLLGAVDSILDWQEDAFDRVSHPFKYWMTFAAKWILTPLGPVMMAMEFTWDLLLLRRGIRLVRFKWQEFFSLAYYHDWICPEKSNDIFYADMAWARYRNDPYFYQWNRLRALVFEIQHYRLDLEAGTGVAESNLLRQDPITAFQSLKRLKIESLEQAVDAHFQNHLDHFPIPEPIARRLIAQAKPIQHYLRNRDTLRSAAHSACPIPMAEAFAQLTTCFPDTASNADTPSTKHDLDWHVLRLIDANQPTFGTAISPYITLRDLDELVKAKILDRVPLSTHEPCFRFCDTFRSKFESFLGDYFEPATPDREQHYLCSKLPTLLIYEGLCYVPKQGLRLQSS
jgi:hypothetical protein